MVTRKDRRHDGYVSPRATIPKKELLKHDLFINDFYDDWEDDRDGFRDWQSDNKSIKNVSIKQNGGLFGIDRRLIMNKKQKMLVKRRKRRQMSIRNRVNK